jgi:hypothetical protein
VEAAVGRLIASEAPRSARWGMTRLWPLVALLACSRSTPPVTTAPTAQREPPPAVEVQPQPQQPQSQPSEPPPPTDADFAAWEHKSPDDAKLRAWDTANLDRMLGYWTDLACFRDAVRAEVEAALGAAPGSAEEERFFQFKLSFVQEVNAWQQNLFSSEQRILERSSIIGRLLEAHEIVAFAYPRAVSAGDRDEIEKLDAHWLTVETKTKKYVESLGATWVAPVCSGPKQPKTKQRKR